MVSSGKEAVLRGRCVFFALAGVVLFLPWVSGAQERETVRYMSKEKEALLAAPGGERLAEVYVGTGLDVLEKREGWLKVRLTGWVRSDSTTPSRQEAEKLKAEYQRPVELVRYKIQKLSKDLHRDKKPYGAHVRAYFQFKNNSGKTITGLIYRVEYRDSFGDLLHEETYRDQLRIEPGKTNPRENFWYYEDNEFVEDEPYDRMQSAADSGTMKAEVSIKKVVFEDGSMVDL